MGEPHQRERELSSCAANEPVQGGRRGRAHATARALALAATCLAALLGGASPAAASVVPPALTIALAPTTIPLNGVSQLTITVTNPNTSTTLTGVNFSDNFTPGSGLQVANPAGIGRTCSGTWNATPGDSFLNFGGGTLPPGSDCSLTVNLTSTRAGVINNATNPPGSNEGATGVASNAATLTVVAPPSIAMVFGAASISPGGTTPLTFTITNPAANTVAETGVAFTDTFPTGLVVAVAPGDATSCGGTFSPDAGATSISVAGGTIAAGSTCTVVVNVTGTEVGELTNTSGPVSSTNGGTGNTASAILTVASPPSISKAFGASAIPLNGSTPLTFTISNANATVALTGVGFSDAFPAGLVVSTPSGLTNSCGGTMGAAAGGASVSLTGATIAASSSCTVVVNVTGTAVGELTNTTRQVSANEGGTGNTATATVTVVAPPSIATAFSPTSIPLNGMSTLAFAITNPAANAVAEAGVAFADTLPAGLVVATPNGLTNSCGGMVSAVAGGTSLSLTGGSLAVSSSCTVAVNVIGTTGGEFTNTSDAISSTNGGSGNTATAKLTVVVPPAISATVGASSISLGGSTSLAFTIANPNAGSSLSGVGFIDTLPAGLEVATPNGLSGSCPSGTVTASAGSDVIALTGAALTAASNCTFSIEVTTTATGTLTDTTSTISSTEAGNGNAARAELTVQSPSPPPSPSPAPPSTPPPPSPSPAPPSPSPSPSPPPTSPPPKAKPSHQFLVSEIHGHRNGNVTFFVKVLGPGTIDVLETAWDDNFATATAASALLQPAPNRFVFSRKHVKLSRGGRILITVKPYAKGLRLIKHHSYKVRIRVWVTYIPTGGTQHTIGFEGARSVILTRYAQPAERAGTAGRDLRRR